MNPKGKRIAILELWVPYCMKEEGRRSRGVEAGGAQSYASKHGDPVTVDVPRPTP